MGNELAEDNVFDASNNSVLGGKDQLIVTEEAKECLLNTTKWTKFLAIVGCIGCVFLLGFGITFAARLSAVNDVFRSGGADVMAAGGIVGFIYILCALIVIYPIIKMFKFSSKTRSALLSNNEHALADALQEMRRIWKFYGLITAVCLAFEGIAIFIGLLVAVFH